MIDDNRKFIFVENPKTATFSVKLALLGEQHIYDHLNPIMATINHDIPRVIKKKYPKKWQDYISFVVVRNTWDRAHSFFHFYSEVAGAKSYQEMGFDQWVARGCPPPNEASLRAPMHGEGRFDDVLSQLRYIYEVDEVIVLHSFDSAERIKALELGMDRVCNRLKIEPIEIPTKGNNYKRSQRTIHWQKVTVEKIGEKYKKEIEQFGFKEPPLA